MKKLMKLLTNPLAVDLAIGVIGVLSTLISIRRQKRSGSATG